MLTPPKVGFAISLAIAVLSARLHAEGTTATLEAGLSALTSSDYEAAEKELKAAAASESAA